MANQLGTVGRLPVPALRSLALPSEWDIAFDFPRIPLGFPQCDASAPEAEGSR